MIRRVHEAYSYTHGLLGQKISVEQKALKIGNSNDFSNGFTPRLHLLKVNHPMNDESTLRDVGCFFFGLVDKNFGLKYNFFGFGGKNYGL